MLDWAKPGNKVVCVRSPSTKFLRGHEGPKVNQVYTIRSVSSGTNTFGEQAIGFRLVELVLPEWNTTDGIMEPLFSSDCFRPLVTKTIEEDMEIFAPLLNVTKIEESV